MPIGLLEAKRRDLLREKAEPRGVDQVYGKVRRLNRSAHGMGRRAPMNRAILDIH